MSEAPYILFFAPFGDYKVHHQLDCVVATALRLRGCDVCMVSCDGLIRSSCDVLSWSGDEAEKHCAVCVGCSRDFYGMFGLPTVQLRAQLAPQDFERAEAWVASIPTADYLSASYEGIPIGSYVISSVFTFFRITATELILPKVQTLHRAILKNGLLTYWAIERIIAARRPHALIAYNARFAPYRIAFEVARKHNIRVMTHERGFSDDTFICFADHSAIATEPIHNAARTWSEIPLTESELEIAKNYFISREKGTDLNWTAFYDYRSDYTQVRTQLRIPAGAKMVGVFTSSEFELALCDDFSTLTRQLDLIDDLIEFFRGREEFLVIRHHPFIAGNPRTYPDTGFLARAYQQAAAAPHNVRVVFPSEQLTGYALLSQLSAAVALFSTVGLEAVARGVPTLCLPESPYREGLRHVVPEVTKEALLKSVMEILSNESRVNQRDLERAYRFMHTYIRRLSIKFKSFGMREISNPDLRFKSAEELRPGCDPTLDRVCEYLLKGTAILEHPSSEERARSPDIESTFFTNELQRLTAQRKQLEEATLAEEQSFAEPGVSILTVGSGEEVLHGRHRNCHCFQTNDASIAALASSIATLPDDYVWIRLSNVTADEAFISSAVSALLSAGNADGIMSGAWLRTEDHRLRGEIFTSRVPAAKICDALATLPWLQEPIALLSFAVFKKTPLLALLNQLARCTPEEVVYFLFRFLHSESILRTTRASLLIEIERAAISNPIRVALLSQFEARSNEEVATLVTRAVRCLSMSDFAGAQALLNAARNEKLTARDLEYAQAICLLQQSQAGEAVQALQRELASFPDNSAARQLLNQLIINPQ